MGPFKNKSGYILSLKGAAMIAAVESGLLPQLERDGVEGYDDELFGRFWDMFLELSEKTDHPLRK